MRLNTFFITGGSLWNPKSRMFETRLEFKRNNKEWQPGI